jgi:hypothetical protein
MNTKLISVIALLVALAPMSALSQQQPKASKADVQKVVNSIKGDNAKMTAFCGFVKLQGEIDAIAAKNENDPKLESLGKQLEDSAKKVGPDFEKIMTSESDKASGALLEDLSKSCK